MDGSFTKCPCDHCGGNIEFPTASAGVRVSCPHCGSDTTLRGKQTTGVIKIIVLMVLCVLIAIGAAILKGRTKESRAANPSATATPATNSVEKDPESPKKFRSKVSKPRVINDFKLSHVRIEKNDENGLVYVLGTAKNLAKTQRFGVKVELDLHNHRGKSVGKTSDYLPVLEPEHEWNFKALVTESDAISAEVAEISESH